MNHLGDEQLAQWLAGEADEHTQAHLHSCEQCRTEATALRDGLSRYSIALRQHTSRAEGAHLAHDFNASKALALHRLRWAAAGVLALALAAPTAWMIGSRPPATASHPATAAVLAPGSAPQQNASRPSPSPATTELAAQITDDQLLEEVNNDLSREVPQALAPVSVITTARNEAVTSRLNTGKSGKVSDFEGESK